MELGVRETHIKISGFKWALFVWGWGLNACQGQISMNISSLRHSGQLQAFSMKGKVFLEFSSFLFYRAFRNDCLESCGPQLADMVHCVRMPAASCLDGG